MHPITRRWLPLGLLSLALSLACSGLSPDEPTSTDESSASPAPDNAEHVEETSYGNAYDVYLGEGSPGVQNATRATASSTLKPRIKLHSAMRASDQDLATAWCEGSDGIGQGESLTLSWEQPVALYAVEIWGGYFKDEDRLFHNGRLESYRLTLDSGEPWIVKSTAPQRGNFKNNKDFPNIVMFPDSSMVPGHDGSQSKTTSLTIEITKVFPGEKYQDTCISEVKIWTFPITCDDCGD